MIMLGFHARCSLWPGLLQFHALSQQSVARWRGSPATTRWSSQACSGALSVRRSEAALSRCRLHAQDGRAVTQGLDSLSHVRSLALEHVKVACLPPRLDALMLVRCRLKECPLPQGWRLQSLAIRSLQRPGRDTHTPACLHAACMFQCVPLVLHAPMLVKCCPEARYSCLRVCVRRRAAVCAALAAAVTPSTWSTG